MKSVSLFFRVIFISSTPFKIILIVFLSGSIGCVFGISFFGGSFEKGELLELRIPIYAIIVCSLIYILIKAFLFLKRYKKEALFLTNKEFEEKYYNLTIKPIIWPVWLHRYDVLIREIEQNPDKIEFNKEKKEFLFKIHYRIYIYEFILIFLGLILIILLSIIVEMIPNIIKKTLFQYYDNQKNQTNNSLKGLPLLLIFIGYTFFTFLNFVLTRNFLTHISCSLIKSQIKYVYNSYKKTPAIFFMPKPKI